MEVQELTSITVAGAASMRRAMSRFSTGVAVITALSSSGRPHGMTINSLTSVSVEPPMLLACLAIGSRTADAVAESGYFAISILAARQEAIARRFASGGADHFAGLPASYGEHDLPVVPGALAHLACTLSRTVVAGDHVIVLGTVTDICEREGHPLVFFAGRISDSADARDELGAWFF